jgi:hypothetical protein
MSFQFRMRLDVGAILVETPDQFLLFRANDSRIFAKTRRREFRSASGDRWNENWGRTGLISTPPVIGAVLLNEHPSQGAVRPLIALPP